MTDDYTPKNGLKAIPTEINVLSISDLENKSKMVDIPTKPKAKTKGCSFKIPQSSYTIYKKISDSLDKSFNDYCAEALRFYSDVHLDRMIKKKLDEKSAKPIKAQLSTLKKAAFVIENEEVSKALEKLLSTIKDNTKMQTEGTTIKADPPPSPDVTVVNGEE